MPDYLKKLVKFSFLGKINIDIVPESFKKFPEKIWDYQEGRAVCQTY